MLKPVIASLEEVAEPLRGEYKADGAGRYVLDTNVEEHPGLLQLKNSLANARSERNTAKENLEKLAGVDPVRYQELVKQDLLVKEGKLIAEGKLDELVALRTTALRDDLTGKLSQSEQRAQKLQADMDRLVIDNAVHSAAPKVGVKKTATEDVIERARRTFTSKDGQAVAMKDSQVVYGKDGITPLGIEEWVAGLPAVAPHLFEESKGSGAPGNGNPPKPPVAPGVINRNDHQAFLANLDAIAKGKMKVQ